MEILLYLFLSVSLSAGRSITSKKTAADAGRKAQFFLSQTVLFAAAALLLLLFGGAKWNKIAPVTPIYGILYGLLLILSQWMFTLALKSGSTSVCSVVYSLGFILPTVSGTLFWNEAFRFSQLIGILISVVIILLSARKSDADGKGDRRLFVPCIVTAMLSSGGLGIMQKVQQSSPAADEKGIFLLIAFCFAAFCSFAAFLLCRERAEFSLSKALYPAVTGLCFGGANLCNTVLAGRMKSAVFFPLQNISTILLTTLLGIVIFKEKLTPRTVSILLLGTTVILLFSL